MQAKLDLISALNSLPAPQYEYELAAPEEVEEEDDSMGVEQPVEDAADIAAREREIKRLEAEIEFASRSTVVRREGDAALPRFAGAVNANAVLIGDDKDGVEKEMLLLLQHDQHKHPVVAAGEKKSKKRKKGDEGSVAPAPPTKPDRIPLDYIEGARAALEKEAGPVPRAFEDAIIAASEEERKSSYYCGGVSGWVTNPNKNNKIEAMRYERNVLAEEVEKIRKKSDKIAKKLNVRLAGYEKKAGEVIANVTACNDEIGTVVIDEVVYNDLLVNERWAINDRLTGLKNDVEDLKAKEAVAQKEWVELTGEGVTN